jgi:hypothetical protein
MSVCLPMWLVWRFPTICYHLPAALVLEPLRCFADANGKCRCTAKSARLWHRGCMRCALHPVLSLLHQTSGEVASERLPTTFSYDHLTSMLCNVAGIPAGTNGTAGRCGTTMHQWPPKQTSHSLPCMALPRCHHPSIRIATGLLT